MTNFLWLLKINISNLFSTKGKKANVKRKRTLSFGLCALFVVLIGGVGFIYSKMIAEMLAITGGIEKLVPTMIGLSAIVCFFLSFYSTGSDLYAFKDYQLLSSMPIKKRTVVLSKLSTSLIFDGVISLLLTVCALINFSIYGGTVLFTYVLFSLLISLFTPFIVVAISSFVAFLVSYLSSKFKNKNLAKSIIFSVFFFALMGGYIYITAVDENAIIGVINKIFFLFPWVEKGVLSGLYTLLYCGVALISFAIIFTLICALYERIYSAINSIKTDRKYQHKSYALSSQEKALLKKELKTLFSNPTYMMNSILGPIMAIAFSVVIAVVLKGIEGIELNFLYLLVPPIFVFCFLMAPSTSSSISLEGKAFWIIKTSPIKARKILDVKLLTNLIISFVPALISGVIIAVILGGVVEGIFTVLISISTMVFGTNLGLILNILFPKFDWASEKQVVKQSLPVFIQTMVVFALSGGLVALIFLIENINVMLYLIILASLFILLCIISYIFIAIKGEYLLNKKTAS